MNKINPIQALETIYKIARAVNLNAEQHDEIKALFEIVKSELKNTEAETKEKINK